MRRARPDDLRTLARLGRLSYRQHCKTLWAPQRLNRWLDEQFGAPRLRRELVDPQVRYFIAVPDFAAKGIETKFGRSGGCGAICPWK